MNAYRAAKEGLILPRKPCYGGATFNAAADTSRLNDQTRRIFDVMRDGAWRTATEIEKLSGIGWASASARLRDLRKEQFGGFQVDRRRREPADRGIFEYRVRPPAPRSPDLFSSAERGPL
jgi:hypothetical protein